MYPQGVRITCRGEKFFAPTKTQTATQQPKTKFNYLVLPSLFCSENGEGRCRRQMGEAGCFK